MSSVSCSSTITGLPPALARYVSLPARGRRSGWLRSASTGTFGCEVARKERTMEPTVLFGIQFTLSLLAFLLIAFWYVVPRLAGCLGNWPWCHCYGYMHFASSAGRSWL